MPRRALWYVAALVPFVAAAVRALADDWFPIGDGAQLYIRATDVLTRHHPWIGSGSSASVELGFQVNNAGPTYFDLIAPFARTLPAGPGNVIGVTVVNALCLVLAAVAARRIGGAAYEAWVLAAGSVLAWTMGSELLFDMFQAHALLFPFLAALVLLSGVAAGQTWVWPWLALLLTTIAQTHVSYAYILIVVVVAALAVRQVGRLGVPGTPGEAPEPGQRPGARHVWAWTAGVLAVTWFQPLYEQLSGPGEGNLSRLARAARADTIAVGLRNAVKLIAAYVCLPPWAGRQGFESTLEPSGVSGGRVVLVGMPPGWLAVLALLLTLGLLVLVWWWAGRQSLPVLRTLALFAALVLVGSVLAMSRLTVTSLGLAPHHTRWVFPVALLVYLVLAWGVCGWARYLLGERVPVVLRAVPGTIAGVVLLVASVLNVPQFAQPHGPTADVWTMPALRQTFRRLDRFEFEEPVYYDVSNERIYAPYSSAIQAHLGDLGVEFRVEPEFLVRQLGESRRAGGTEPTTIMHFEKWAAFEPPPGCVIARTSGLDPGEDAAVEARGRALAREVGRALRVAVPDDAPEIDRQIAADPSHLTEITFDGRLRYWLDAGWASLDDPEVAERLEAEGPELTEWLDRLFALVVTDPAECPQG